MAVARLRLDRHVTHEAGLHAAGLDPQRLLRSLQSCPTLRLDFSGFTSPNQPFLTSGGRLGGAGQERPSRGSSIHRVDWAGFSPLLEDVRMDARLRKVSRSWQAPCQQL